MNAGPGFAQTASGILIPAQTLDRLHRTVPEKDFVKLKRLLAFAKSQGMKAFFTCDTCHEPIRMNHHQQIVTEHEDRTPAGGGRLSLECGCTTWQVR